MTSCFEVTEARFPKFPNRKGGLINFLPLKRGGGLFIRERDLNREFTAAYMFNLFLENQPNEICSHLSE